MTARRYRCLLISDFNISNLANYLNNNEEFPLMDAEVAPFGQVMQVLMQGNYECWRKKYDSIVVWTRPESIISSFNNLIQGERFLLNEILEQVDKYASALLRIHNKAQCIFVPTWVFPSCNRGYGVLDMRPGVGIASTLMQMNLRLSEKLSKDTNIYLLNAQKWIENAGKSAFNNKLWYMAKIVFGNEVFIDSAKDIKAALNGIAGNAKKLIILDLDDILWGGIVGEVGWKKIKLGGHDHIGEAYVDFQHALKMLFNRGIMLGIVSKNDENIALKAIKNHPEMVLRLDDFVGWKINWLDKAKNIVDLTSKLNLGLQSVVFIDDSPAERDRVRNALPEVYVPDWPGESTQYKSTLLSLHCFDVPSFSSEDFNRTKMYITEHKRTILKKKLGSVEQWLRTLKIKVKIDGLNDANLQRVVQLLNRTNQMNLTTRRMTESELMRWARRKNCKLWVFCVSDKFGDYGLTGIVSLEIKDKIANIVDFVLSCRVIGRKIEEVMLHTAIEFSRSRKLNEICATYIPTAKNKPCLEFFRKSDFTCSKNGHFFSFNISKNRYPIPKDIHIEGVCYAK